MKDHLLKYSVLLIVAVVFGCSSYKDKQQRASLTIPDLGAIVQKEGAFWFANTEQIGRPKFKTTTPIHVQVLPFNKLSYGTYSQYMTKSGEPNNIIYVDSLPNKPKYIRLEIADRIALVSHFNGPENSALRSYLATDSAYKLVTSWSIAITDIVASKLSGASKVTLSEDAASGAYLVLKTKKGKERIALSEIHVFDYEYASFCWGEDRYHRKKIKTIVSGAMKCTKGTFKKASKTTSNQSYLEF